MATILTGSKTASSSLLGIQIWNTATTLISSPVDVSTKFSGMIYVRFGRGATTALAAHPNFRIEASSGSGAGSNNDEWYTIYGWSTANATTAAASVAATAANSGQKVVTVTATTFAVRDYVFLLNGTVASSEWARVVTKTSTTALNVEDNLTNAQTTSQVTSLAEVWAIPVDLSAVTRIRFVADGATVFTTSCYIEAIMTTLDSISGT